MEQERIDFTGLKYVLYARKSTDDQKRQVRSIPDQISDCEEVALRLKLNVSKPYLRETKSAKKPHKRLLYRKMIDDIKAGKHDAILVWAPDRLARNMLEAGELIDLIDQGVIKDVKFVSTSFTPDPQGMMMLGMSFVLSKQYSDDLSQKIRRGVYKSRQEGKSSTFRHGYRRNNDGYQVPDGKNFDLIKKAWDMRYQGHSLEQISKYMNENGYKRVIKRSKEIQRMSFKTLSKIFKDTFYYGLLIEGGDQIDLSEKYNFIPATSQEVFIYIQKMSKGRLASFNLKKLTFYPLKGLVMCAYCHKNCVVAPSKGRTKRYLYYRCDNAYCLRKKRSVRAKVVFDFIYDFFRESIKFTKRDYDTYVKSSKSLTESNHVQISTELATARAELRNLGIEQDKMLRALGQLTADTSSAQKAKERLNEIERKVDSVQNQINNLEQQKKTDPKDLVLSLTQFLNLCKNAVNIIESASALEKDHICRSVFLNLEVDEQKVTYFRLKEPFESLMKMRSFPTGGDGGN